MIFQFVIFLASVAALCVAVVVPGMLDLVLLAGPCVLASLVLLLGAFLRWRRRPALSRVVYPKRPVGPFFDGVRPLPKRGAERWIVVDGSNVMHWKDGTPQIETLIEVLDRLRALGFSPGVVFDANAGYKIEGRYQNDHAFGKLLGLPEDRVLVVAKGTQADGLVLAAASDLKARIVTNDRYRDWAETHPEVRDAGHLIRGGYRDGVLWLDVG